MGNRNIAAFRPNIRFNSYDQDKYEGELLSPDLSDAAEPPVETLEIDTLKCPLSCVCQYAHFNDLPISRWINHMQGRQPEPEPELDDVNDSEITFEGDETFLSNPFVKQATCILQDDSNAEELINILPHDLQALILLYTGIGHNKTVNASILKPLNQLTTLEIRGPQDRSMRFVFDEPLSFLQHANFESITLLGSEKFKRPRNPVHPRDHFDYKPKSELFAAYDYASKTQSTAAVDDKPSQKSKQKLSFKSHNEDNGVDDDDFDLEILSYEEYMIEMKKSRMPNFYGWQHLEVLRIHGCRFNELHWEMFDGLEALQHLSLQRNELTTVPAFALSGALHLKTLSLAHNRIHSMHYRDLAGLLELEWLDLSDNRLTRLSELSFPPFPKLVHVDFRQNPIRYIFPAAFWVMNKTQTMFFGSPEEALELMSNGPFENLNDMRELSAANVSIGGLEQNILKGLSSLEKLSLKGAIRSIEFDAFTGLVRLRELDLSSCGIQDISMDAFMGCKQLQTIDLSHNNLSYLPPGLFDDQIALTEIYLNDNRLRTLPTTFFLQPKLRLARLTDNPWRCSCDMFNWRAKITNQERSSRDHRCISDYQTGKKFGCRPMDNYKFDHRHAPRCNNFNGRSVYYVIRKQLECGPGRVVRRPHKARTPRISDSGEQTKESSPDYRSKWQIRREQKTRRTMILQNTLNYMLHQGQRHQFATKTQAGDLEVSNEI